MNTLEAQLKPATANEMMEAMSRALRNEIRADGHYFRCNELLEKVLESYMPGFVDLVLSWTQKMSLEDAFARADEHSFIAKIRDPSGEHFSDQPIVPSQHRLFRLYLARLVLTQSTNAEQPIKDIQKELPYEQFLRMQTR